MNVRCIAPLRAVTRKRGVKYDVNTVNSSLGELVDHVGTPCGRGKPMPGSDISSLRAAALFTPSITTNQTKKRVFEHG